MDEFQLVNFIIKSKGLQFITGGLIGGALGFVKLFRCSTTEDIDGPKGCEYKAPGVTKFFRFQFALLLVRSVLVWITFILLFNSETIERWDKKAQADAATSYPRRGLFKPTKTAGFMAINWILFIVNVSLTLRNIHDGRETGVSAFDTVAMNFCLVLIPLNYLLNVRKLRWYPAVVAGGMAVDYVLHMSHAYNHQDPSLTSNERVRRAMAAMGISVLSGCLTTFGACCALFSCELLWFKMFGYFICTLIFSSFIVSNFGMMALLAWYGPTGGRGDVDVLKHPGKYLARLKAAVKPPADAKVIV